MFQLVRFLLLVAPATALAACRDHIIIDDFGTSGYARIEGKVVRSNGVPLGNSGVFYLCGSDSPTGFGASVPTDAAGHFFVDVDAPGPVTIPASGSLRCRFSAPNNTPPIVSVERSVQFSVNPDVRPLTVVDLLEP